MRLVIITINYNGSENTIKLLKSLTEQTGTSTHSIPQGSEFVESTSLRASQDFQTIVVDNASEEADFDNLKKGITMGTIANAMVPMVIRNKDNLGFSGGNNMGIKKALDPSTSSSRPELGTKAGQENGSLLRQGFVGQADWVVLLNNDTWAEKDFIACLKPILTKKQGIVGLPLNEGDQIAYCGKIQWFKSTLKHSYELPVTNYRLQKIYAIGGAVAIHKDVFDKIGLWDEKYFLYFEDADFSLRAQKAGIPVTIVPDVMIHHNTSSTTKKLGSPLLLRYHYRNALYFNLKNGPWYIKSLVWPWSLIIVLKQILKVMIYHNQEQSLAILKGVFDFYRHRMGK